VASYTDHRIIFNQSLAKVKDGFRPYSKNMGTLVKIDSDKIKCDWIVNKNTYL
jgi:hypothetical protein